MLFLGSTHVYFRGKKSSYSFIETHPVDPLSGCIPLPTDLPYISVGTDQDFYKRLVRYAGLSRARKALRVLHDLTILTAPGEAPTPDLLLRDDEAYEVSLNRGGSARAVLPRAASIVFGMPRQGASVAFTLHMRLRGFKRDHIVSFDFTESLLPGSINVLIGTNGSGKTQTLLHLIDYVFELRRYRAREKAGRATISPTPKFRKVVALSLSPYSTLPKEASIPKRATSDYTRITFFTPTGRFSLKGLKTRTIHWLRAIMGEHMRGENDELKLRIPRLLALIEKFSIDRLVVRGTLDDKQASVALTNPPKRETHRLLAAPDSSIEFRRNRRKVTLSSGQQQVFFMALGLLAELENDSLILLDEPELYLHPNLEIDFLELLQDLLDTFDSYAVIATHSNTIVRELPRTAIRVFRSIDGMPTVKMPQFQTFGADISEIANRVFDEVYADRPFERWLVSRFGERSFDEVVRDFGSLLNEESLALLYANSRRRGDEQSDT